jgi:hypothetical protein
VSEWCRSAPLWRPTGKSTFYRDALGVRLRRFGANRLAGAGDSGNPVKASRAGFKGQQRQ